MPLLDLLLFLAGLALLALGAEALVRGASAMAARMGVPSIVVGLTVVAVGTTMPEFVVSVLAAWQGAPGVAVGNVVGSNVVNTLLVLGLIAVLAPVRLAPTTLHRDFPLVLAISLFAWLLCMDGRLTRLDGGLLLAGVVPFLLYAYRRETRRRPVSWPGSAAQCLTPPAPDAPSGRHPSLMVLLVVAGAVLLAVGARMVVGGGIALAETFGVSDRIIGLTLVAFGTSLPELATGVAAALRGRTQIAVGNVLGANVLNLLLTLGMAAAVRPFRVPGGTVFPDFPVMLLALAFVMLLAWPRRRLGRPAGAVLLAAYAAYLGYLVLTV